MPSRRPAAILQHLERQADALGKMHAKIRDQLRRLQIEERYLKKKLSATQIEPEDIESPAPVSAFMDVDVVSPPKEHPPPSKPTVSPKETSVPAPEEEEEEEEDDDGAVLPPSLRSMRSTTYLEDDDEDDDEDVAMDQVRMILASQRGR